MQNIKIPAIGIFIEDKFQADELLKKFKNDVVMIVCNWDEHLINDIAEKINLRSNLFLACIFDTMPVNVSEVVKNSKLGHIDMAMITKVRDINVSSDLLFKLSKLEESNIINCISTFNVSALQVSLLIEKIEYYPVMSVLELHPSLGQKFSQDYLSDLGIALGGYRCFTNMNNLEEVKKIGAKLNTSSENVISKWLHQRQIFNIMDYKDYELYFDNIDLESIKIKLEDMNKITSLSNGMRLFEDPENI